MKREYIARRELNSPSDSYIISVTMPTVIPMYARIVNPVSLFLRSIWIIQTKGGDMIKGTKREDTFCENCGVNYGEVRNLIEEKNPQAMYIVSSCHDCQNKHYRQYRKAFGKCETCGQLIENHEKCDICGILIGENHFVEISEQVNGCHIGLFCKLNYKEMGRGMSIPEYRRLMYNNTRVIDRFLR